MLIKDQIKDVILNQLKKINTNFSDSNMIYITIDWDDKTDDFNGTIYLNNMNRRYDFCVEFSDSLFELVWIKEINTQFSKNLIYSIDGEK